MTDLVRVKRGRHPWVTEPESGGGGGGSEDLATVLANGNDGGGQQITNIADGVADQDAFTVAQFYVLVTLANLLSNGNDGAGQQVKNIGDGTDVKDAVNLQQLQAYVPTLAAILAGSESAGGHNVQDVADLNADTLNVTGGDDSGPVAKITPPPNATNSVAEIGPQNLGLIVGPDGSVQNRADDSEAGSLVGLQRGSVAVYIDAEGVHMVGLPLTDPHIVGVLWQDVDVVKVSLGP